MTAEETPAQRRARLNRAAALLGDLVPKQTTDDRNIGWGDDLEHDEGGASHDDKLASDVPPHHGKD